MISFRSRSHSNLFFLESRGEFTTVRLISGSNSLALLGISRALFLALPNHQSQSKPTTNEAIEYFGNCLLKSINLFCLRNHIWRLEKQHCAPTASPPRSSARRSTEVTPKDVLERSFSVLRDAVPKGRYRMCMVIMGNTIARIRSDD